MGKSNYLENLLLDHVMGGPDYTRPGTLYVALYNVAPTDVGGGTEVSGGSYTRLAIANNSTNFPAASSGSKSNGIALTFPTPSAGWGVIVAFGILDASTAGNLLRFGSLSITKTIDPGDTITFPVGALVSTED